ncbi:conserved hypothetical protein [Histoplasma capsulatum var. duboisii H88]|uniref:Uncharacterized protein n=1 Tax=Ajellomyces capsulatus (strain H88) TaxID=544711 RepID=F0UIF6_AJEC8|nr:conserved hypothetical protein [Histoplasma capsulatum var. duboisii H88]QSS56218.1 hypothetical protein I7I53_04369 [Histoplasma capsulatum var. duboisii H88]
MFDSPTIVVSASNTAQKPQATGTDIPQPRLPSRASFQSPTKASLSRSHPDVLARVLSRSPPKSAHQRPVSRGRENASLGVGGVEGGRSGVSGSKLPTPSPLSTTSALVTELPIRQQTRQLVSSTQRHGSSVRVSASQSLSMSSHRSRASFSLEPGIELPEPPLPSRARDPASGQTADETTADGRPTRSSSSPAQGNGEPELPPTPTELGIERLPNRPRGLLSSSSPSYRREKKRKRRTRDAVKKPSPLKPKDADITGNEPGDGIASPRSLFPEEDYVPNKFGDKVELRNALTAQLARLKKDISKIEYETQRYEKPDQYPAPDTESIKNLIELLTTSNPSCAPPPPTRSSQPPVSSLLCFLLPFASPRCTPIIKPTPPTSTFPPPPENPFALQQPADLIPYLTLFAPLSLTAHTTTVSTPIVSISPQESSQSSTLLITQTHNLTLVAPHPFPARLFQIPITLQTNPESQTVISISIPAQSQPNHSDTKSNHNIPTALFSWLQIRLSNPLLHRDISGLCWGISRYWEADLSRAKLWAQLEELRDRIMTTLSSSQKGSLPSRDDNDSNNNNSKTRQRDTPRDLLPHLGQTSFLFSVETRRQRQERRSEIIVTRQSSPQLLVSCPLTLDLWTSEPQLQPDISVSVPLLSPVGSLEKVEKEAKSVFASFLRSGRGGKERGYGQMEIDGGIAMLVRAVEGVARLLFGVA